MRRALALCQPPTSPFFAYSGHGAAFLEKLTREKSLAAHFQELSEEESVALYRRVLPLDDEAFGKLRLVQVVRALRVQLHEVDKADGDGGGGGGGGDDVLERLEAAGHVWRVPQPEPAPAATAECGWAYARVTTAIDSATCWARLVISNSLQ